MKSQQDWQRDLAAHRRKNFAVKVTKARFQSGPDQMDLSVTLNGGSHWTSISLNRDEILRVIVALQSALK